MSNTTNHNKNLEVLRERRPEAMAQRRQQVIDHAIANLLPFAETAATRKPADVYSQQVESNMSGAQRPADMRPEVREEVAKMGEQREQQHLEHLSAAVYSLYEGRGNPLYDQEAA